MANLIWNYNNLGVNETIHLGDLEHLEESNSFTFTISHDSNLEITDCGFYLDLFQNQYSGSFFPRKDLERVLWLANNYPGYGLSIRQRYEVSGEVGAHSGIKLIDFDRKERTDIFSGSQIEILNGEASGQLATISSYNINNQVFILGNDFSVDVTGASYKIVIDQEKFFKTGQGSSYDNKIPLIYKGGVIERYDQATIDVKLRIPKFAQSAGNFLFDLKMHFTSLEES